MRGCGGTCNSVPRGLAPRTHARTRCRRAQRRIRHRRRASDGHVARARADCARQRRPSGGLRSPRRTRQACRARESGRKPAARPEGPLADPARIRGGGALLLLVSYGSREGQSGRAEQQHPSHHSQPHPRRRAALRAACAGVWAAVRERRVTRDTVHGWRRAVYKHGRYLPCAGALPEGRPGWHGSSNAGQPCIPPDWSNPPDAERQHEGNPVVPRAEGSAGPAPAPAPSRTGGASAAPQGPAHRHCCSAGCLAAQHHRPIHRGAPLPGCAQGLPSL